MTIYLLFFTLNLYSFIYFGFNLELLIFVMLSCSGNSVFFMISSKGKICDVHCSKHKINTSLSNKTKNGNAHEILV